MARLTTIILYFIFFSAVASGQRTPEELGQLTFDCFQKNQLDSLFKLKPTLSDLTEFGRSLGVDTGSEQYQEFMKRYPLVIENYKEKCHQLLYDTTELGLNWKIARVDTIEKSTKILPLDNRNSKNQTVTITIVDIYIISNGKGYKLTLGDVASYNGIWKPGNNIEITRQ